MTKSNQIYCGNCAGVDRTFYSSFLNILLIYFIASMMDMKPLSEDISPDVIEMMIEIIVEGK